jgi:transposase
VVKKIDLNALEPTTTESEVKTKAKKPKKKAKKKVQRKKLYEKIATEKNLELVRAKSRMGLTDSELAKMLNISEATFYKWKNKYVEFREAVNEPKPIADAVVVNSAHKLATGFEYIEEQPIKLKRTYWENGKKVEEEYVEIVKVKKVVPPNAQSQQHWLRNRDNANWADKQNVDVTGSLLVTALSKVKTDTEF